MIESFNNIESESKFPQTSAEDSENQVKLSEIFTSEFMRLYTQFESIEDLLSSGGFVINSEEDYDAIPDEDIDAHIAKTTNFQSWKEMLTEATDTYLNKRSEH